MLNAILNWSFDKPTENGFYLACNGDVEAEANITPFRLLNELTIHHDDQDWPTVTAEHVAQWTSAFKFARLFVGTDAIVFTEMVQFSDD